MLWAIDAVEIATIATGGAAALCVTYLAAAVAIRAIVVAARGITGGVSSRLLPAALVLAVDAVVVAVLASGPARSDPADAGAGPAGELRSWLLAPAALAAPAADADVGGEPPTPPQPAPPNEITAPVQIHTVAPGDSLWDIAEARLGHGTSDAVLHRAWQMIWATNRDVIGADPNLIRPGQQLVVPDLTAAAKESQ
jgi:nucleoid-associated protein YgaU